MRILLTNDDGIHAEGLCALHDALCDRHEVYVVAPEAERSAVGHAITLVDPLRVRRVKRGRRFFGYAVSGTPADCVKLAVHEIIGPHLDLVLSGINRGANIGVNVLYSGTVSAATEGVILGYPAVAVSLDAYENPDYCFAAYFVSRLLDSLPESWAETRFCLNVNVPALPANLIKGVKVVKQSTRPLVEKFERRVDPHGNVYYWQCSEEFTEDDPETDVVALRAGYITVSPLFHDLTHHPLLSTLKEWKLDF